MRVCLFGGSFDPVHQGHLNIAREAQKRCGLDLIIFLPCACSPLKKVSPLASDNQRIDMLSLAIESFSWARLDLTDMQLPPPSWSWRVAEHIRHEYPKAELFWLMGTDQWIDLERWDQWTHLSEMLTFIVHFRQGCAPLPREGVKSIFIEGDHPASSSAIRQMLHDGEMIPKGWLAPSIVEYIQKNRIYS
ncbi:MAG: nicotinate (nicotinamide) nucleotide adenylyltransferase [Akkermansia sp.]